MKRALVFQVLALLVTGFVLSSPSAFASALFPTVRAGSSANGKFLVILEYGYENSAEEIKVIKQITYRVLQKEDFINNYHRFQSQATYWSNSWTYWEVTIPAGSAPDGGLPLLTDDGAFLVFVSFIWPMSAETNVVTIYQKQDRTGQLVRTLQLKDVWTAEERKTHILQSGATDHTPSWFYGGDFAFSPDNKHFIYTTSWGKRKVINLEHGEVLTD